MPEPCLASRAAKGPAQAFALQRGDWARDRPASALVELEPLARRLRRRIPLLATRLEHRFLAARPAKARLPSRQSPPIHRHNLGLPIAR